MPKNSMSELNLNAFEENEELEYVSEEELDKYLDTVAPYIGWIIIYFNSLEDHIADFLKEGILRDSYQDTRLDVFLSDMMFAAKSQALIKLYGQTIESYNTNISQCDLKVLEKNLQECAKIRNEYAHADWLGVKREDYVKVKSLSKRTGTFNRYKKFEITKLQNDIDYVNEARFSLCKFNDELNLWLINNG